MVSIHLDPGSLISFCPRRPRVLAPFPFLACLLRGGDGLQQRADQVPEQPSALSRVHSVD
jgi:hypothetical protein